ncbi:protein TIFY 10A-like [Cornus florida]|uniref:protein TIFY 10A-like n=1 Tax=Cornus florida TaxID=4283 RepID=UPI0028A17967|nr:protein TIFY 10A-like [Cornus florida]
MSSSQDFSLSRRSGRTPEISNFAQTCNLLSQFMKERGGFRDISMEIAGKLEPKGIAEMSGLRTTMNLLPNMEKSGEIWTQHVKSMDFFPQYAEAASSNTIKDASSSSKSAEMEGKTAQMTIFYGGQVLVFDDFPSEKAKEVMLLASNGSSANSTPFVSTSSVASGSNAFPNSGSNPAQQCLKPQPQPITSDLPIARRASLHRFFEKRKDRATARAPYPLHNPATTASPKQEEQLELRL